MCVQSTNTSPLQTILPLPTSMVCGNTDTTATAESTDAPHCADTALAVTAHDLDAVETEDLADLAELTDADVYQQIANNPMAYPEQESSVEVPSQSCSDEPHILLPTPPIQNDGGDSPLLLELSVMPFSLGHAGALVPGAHQGSSLYQRTERSLGSSIWAPFQSQCDWEVARWAKMRGPTSSAVTDLLAIPGVRVLIPSLLCY